MLTEESEKFESQPLQNKHWSGNLHGAAGARVRVGRGGDTASRAADRRVRALYLDCLKHGKCTRVPVVALMLWRWPHSSFTQLRVRLALRLRPPLSARQDLVRAPYDGEAVQQERQGLHRTHGGRIRSER